MDLDRLKAILIENKIYVDDKSKNYICICPYCGDHREKRKQGHLYVSKNSEIPVAHCWYCNGAWPIPKLIKDLTGDRNLYKDVISDAELKSSYGQSKQYTAKKRNVQYKIPDITEERFSEKKMYIKKRTGNKTNAEDVPNLIVNILDFIAINNLDIVGEGKEISNYEVDMLQRNFVGFLSCNNTLLYCRNIDSNATFSFKKVPLQSDPLLLLDYWSIPLDCHSSTIVLSEGNFDILSEYSFDSLGLRDKARLYASGNTFSYASLIKSICYNESLYKADVVILSDTDKPAHWYKKLLRTNSHIIKTCKIYMNKRGKDFGVYPPLPSQIV